MVKFKRVITYLIFAILIGIITVMSFIKLALPMVGKPEDIRIELTQKRIERGKYLANNVCACTDCHSKRDWNKFPGPVAAGTLGMGGEEFDEQAGFNGKFYAKNITPFALQDWTDGEILRAISSGVSRNGNALSPEMPYISYGQFD